MRGNVGPIQRSPRPPITLHLWVTVEKIRRSWRGCGWGWRPEMISRSSSASTIAPRFLPGPTVLPLHDSGKGLNPTLARIRTTLEQRESRAAARIGTSPQGILEG